MVEKIPENKTKSPWDKLATGFNVGKEGLGDSHAADNVIIAWPTILENLPRNGKILDFGCGAGAFCRLLGELGYDVAGIDSSAQMLVAAKEHPGDGDKISYLQGSSEEIDKFDSLDAITSTMVLQFIENPEIIAQSMSRSLKEEGKAIITVFNPDFVTNCLERGEEIFSRDEEGGQITMRINPESPIDTFVRNEEEYKAIFEEEDLIFVSAQYPPFTEEFVDKYNWSLPFDVPEYMIMVFIKKKQNASKK